MSKRNWLRGLFPESRPLRWALPVSLLLALALIQWKIPAWSARPEGWTVEARFQIRGPERPKVPIVIIALDEASFQMMGDLQGENIRTWPRARWAELVDKITNRSPRLVALDVVFDTPGWDQGGDAALAQALSQSGSSILAAHLSLETYKGRQNVTYSPPIEILANAAAGVGVANFPTDADGAIRRVQLL